MLRIHAGPYDVNTAALSLMICASLCCHIYAQNETGDLNAGEEDVYRSWSIAVGILVVITFIAIIILSVFYFRVDMKERSWKNKATTMRFPRMIPSDFLPSTHLPARHVAHPRLLPSAHADFDYDHQSPALAPLPSYHYNDRMGEHIHGSPPNIDLGLPPSGRFIVDVDDYDDELEAMEQIRSSIFQTRPTMNKTTIYNPLARMVSGPRSQLLYF